MFYMNVISDGTKAIKQGFDFSVASYIPQNIFQNLSPPAAFLGSVDAFSSSEPTITERKPILIEQPLSVSDVTSVLLRKEQIPATVASSPVRKPDETDPKLHNAPMHRSLPCSKTITESVKAEEDIPKSPRSRSSSTFGALQKWLQMGAENRPSLPSASSIPHLKQASSVVEVSKSLVKERIHAISGNERSKSVPTTVSSATQTSPESTSLIPTSVQFNIGTANWTLSSSQTLVQYSSTLSSGITKSSPKGERKRKGASRTRSGNREKDRGKSPQNFEEVQVKLEAPPKEAIGPGQAQSLRAVFGAVLWHAGIIHDAMACASYLRFNKQYSWKEPVPFNAEDQHLIVSTDIILISKQNLPPELPRSSIQTKKEPEAPTKEITSGTEKVVMRKKSDSPAKGKHQRHSVEVTSAAWYLKGNPDLQLEPLGLKLDDDRNDGNVEHVETSGNSLSTVLSTPKKKIDTEFPISDEASAIPPAVTLLEKIWAFVKRSCVDSLTTEDVTLTGNLDLRSSVKLRRDNRRYGKNHSGGGSGEHRKSRKEQPRHLHTMGRSFLLGKCIPSFLCIFNCQTDNITKNYIVWLFLNYRARRAVGVFG